MKRFIPLITVFSLAGCSWPPGSDHPPILDPAPPSTATASGLPACGALPDEAWDTVERIEAGGPFPYPANDDKRFGNYERNLPEVSRNYYREYTVDTPGVNHRGARRIVTGGDASGIEAWFYTDDHYESFCEMEVN